MQTKDRVRAHTARKTNRLIEREIQRRLVYAASENSRAVSRRIAELDEAWDIERWLQANASVLAITGVVLGLTVNKKFLALPCIVLPLLFQHAVQGWCLPIPLLRRFGVRTRRELDAEKFALKAIRGDFETLRAEHDPTVRAVGAWVAVND
jgi:hypothetical protein